jgi:hypothetical protein
MDALVSIFLLSPNTGFDLLPRERSLFMRVAEYTPDNMAAARFIARMVRPCF